MTIIETILSICGLIAIVAGFIFWHTNTIRKVEEKFESKVSDLSDGQQLLKDEMKDLKHRDDMQQMAINSIKELWPLINDNIKKLDQ